MKITRRQLRQMIMEAAGFAPDERWDIVATAGTLDDAIRNIGRGAEAIREAGSSIRGGGASGFPELPVATELGQMAERLGEIHNELRTFRAEFDFSEDGVYDSLPHINMSATESQLD